MADKERLQKYMSRAGVASRRASEKIIAAGRVKVNGQTITEMGFKVEPGVDDVSVDGNPIEVRAGNVYLLLHKPPQVISSASDPHDRPVVVDLIPDAFGRVYPVGRLDWDSEGAILMTDDGDLAQYLTHPKHGVPKIYMVKVKGLLGATDSRIEKIRAGVKLDDGDVTQPADIVRDHDTGKHTWFIVSIKEGKYRQIRRSFEAVGLDVLRLKRIAYGSVMLGELAPGDYRRLSEKEVDDLYKAAGKTRPRLSASRGRLPSRKKRGKKR